MPDPLFHKVWFPLTVDGKDGPILREVKAMGDLVVCGKLVKAMILLTIMILQLI